MRRQVDGLLLILSVAAFAITLAYVLSAEAGKDESKILLGLSGAALSVAAGAALIGILWGGRRRSLLRRDQKALSQVYEALSLSPAEETLAKGQIATLQSMLKATSLDVAAHLSVASDEVRSWLYLRNGEKGRISIHEATSEGWPEVPADDVFLGPVSQAMEVRQAVISSFEESPTEAHPRWVLAVPVLAAPEKAIGVLAIEGSRHFSWRETESKEVVGAAVYWAQLAALIAADRIET
ncbi:hypothetical protein ACHBTE_08690 [Streptomyces sp. M41]|uniref:hypothetical protein n=1 Tax=Streptomyces sp. M41 TaxID=3059412 RepID=UPI00374CF3A3